MDDPTRWETDAEMLEKWARRCEQQEFENAALRRERDALRTGLLLITRDRNAPGWLRGYAQQVLDEGEKAR